MGGRQLALFRVKTQAKDVRKTLSVRLFVTKGVWLVNQGTGKARSLNALEHQDIVTSSTNCKGFW